MANLFKNMLVYTLASGVNIAPDDLEEKLAAKGQRVVGKLEREAVHSWSPPGGKKSQVYLHDIQGQRLIQLKTQKRMVPGSTVKELLEDAVAAEEERTGDKVSGKAKKDMKHHIVDELLPTAPIKTTYTALWWDTKNARVMVGASSRKVAEAALDLLRETLGTFAVVPIATETSPMRGMTNWLRDTSERPGWMELGDKAVLTASSNQDGRFSGSKVDLEGAEVERMLDSGCLVAQMGMKMIDQASFEFTFDHAFKGIKIEDAVRENYGDDETDGNPIAELETEFIIVSDTLTWVIDQVIHELGGESEGDGDGNDEDEAA